MTPAATATPVPDDPLDEPELEGDEVRAGSVGTVVAAARTASVMPFTWAGVSPAAVRVRAIAWVSNTLSASVSRRSNAPGAYRSDGGCNSPPSCRSRVS